MQKLLVLKKLIDELTSKYARSLGGGNPENAQAALHPLPKLTNEMRRRGSGTQSHNHAAAYFIKCRDGSLAFEFIR